MKIPLRQIFLSIILLAIFASSLWRGLRSKVLAATRPGTQINEVHGVSRHPFNVLTTTVSELRDGLQNGSFTSVMIVELYLSQIEAHNHAGAHLNIILSMPEKSRLFAIAQALDNERLAGRIRGPMHGIPIIVKDAFASSPELGMETTVGSWALKASKPRRSATVIETLIRHGLIILGKANLSEFCGMKGPPGWSAVGGQTQSAYIPKGRAEGAKRFGETCPGGSSTGSAQGIAAGFAPLSIGTETSGSLVWPAGRAALYTLKLTPGSTPKDGVFHITSKFDSIGAMSKNVEDVATMSDLLRKTVPSRHSKRELLVMQLGKSWDGISIGFVDIEQWRPSLEDKDFDARYNIQTVG